MEPKKFARTLILGQRRRDIKLAGKFVFAKITLVYFILLLQILRSFRKVIKTEERGDIEFERCSIRKLLVLVLYLKRFYFVHILAFTFAAIATCFGLFITIQVKVFGNWNSSICSIKQRDAACGMVIVTYVTSLITLPILMWYYRKGTDKSESSNDMEASTPQADSKEQQRF